MKNLLRLEELAQFLFCLVSLIVSQEAPWWTILLLLLGPDISMLGYLVSPRVGAIGYNLFHHKGLAIVLVMLGFYASLLSIFGHLSTTIYWYGFVIAGIILYGHASMDRIFGYGLKFGDNFHHTHLGWIGKGKVASGEASVGQ